MKTKKHKTGYRAGNDVKRPIPFPTGIGKPPSNGKPPILWVKKKGKVVKATDEEIKLAKAPKGEVKDPKGKYIPKTKIIVGGKWLRAKKGGKIK
jgi:hypothetical protein